ncbi:hypothetical protein MKX33_05845 [Paenibacillus sp. FSL R5-0490]|uniref:hypothetical protein n=1 Tax=Paenibacillus sp. FSL R5-0490 TaxID=1920424 RepID=UPI0030D5C24D
MNKRNIIIAIIIALIILILQLVLYFSVTNKEESELPDSNIPFQTKTVDELTITLRNATYTDHEVQLGYEIQGGGQSMLCTDKISIFHLSNSNKNLHSQPRLHSFY